MTKSTSFLLHDDTRGTAVCPDCGQHTFQYDITTRAVYCTECPGYKKFISSEFGGPKYRKFMSKVTWED